MFIAYAVICRVLPPSRVPSDASPLRRGPVIAGMVRSRARRALALLTLVGAWSLPAAAADRPRAPGLVVGGMTFVQSEGESVAMVVEAERGNLDPETQIVHLETVTARVSENEERSGFELRCNDGELALETRALLAKGNVRGRTADGRAFSTEWVRYDPKKQLAFTDAPVVIEEATGNLQGGGFRYYVREGRFRLLGGASVRREN